MGGEGGQRNLFLESPAVLLLVDGRSTENAKKREAHLLSAEIYYWRSFLNQIHGFFEALHKPGEFNKNRTIYFVLSMRRILLCSDLARIEMRQR